MWALRLLSVLMIMILISHCANALTITPGKVTFNFYPNAKLSGSFRILNKEHKDFMIKVTKDGELKDMLSLEKKILNITKDTDSEIVKYEINLPTSLSSGRHELRIIVTELPIESWSNGQSVRATTAVVHKIIINVPYSEKVIKADLDTEISAKEVKFYVHVLNFCNDKILVRATTEIFKEDEKVDEIISTKKIDSMQKDDIVLIWQPKDSGDFKAKITLEYENKSLVLEREFELENLTLAIEGFEVEKYSGKIAKFSVNVKNLCEKEVRNVYAILEIENSTYNVKLKSSTENINPFSSKKLYVYWDTNNVSEGVYNATLNLIYANKAESRKFEFEVSQTGISIPGITGAVVGNEIYVLILPILLAILTLYLRRRR